MKLDSHEVMKGLQPFFERLSREPSATANTSSRIHRYGAIAEALCQLKLLDVIPQIPGSDLAYLYQGVCRFARAERLEGEYLALVDMFDRPTPEKRQQKQQLFRANIDLARRQTHFFRVEILIEASLTRSYSRPADLIEGRVPEPGVPDLG